MKQYNFKLIYKKYNKKANTIKNFVILFFLLLFAIFTVLFATGKIQIMHILTSSSAPYHPAGSLAIEYKVDFDKLQVGDFITWSVNNGKSFVTHQIVKIDKEAKTVTTSQQQYNENGVKPMEEWEEKKFDAPKTESQYYGKVLFSIPNVGLYLTSIKEMVILNNSINILGIVSIILAYLVYYFFSKFLHTPTFILWGKRNWQKLKD